MSDDRIRDTQAAVARFDELTKDLSTTDDTRPARQTEMGEAEAFPDDSPSSEADAGVLDTQADRDLAFGDGAYGGAAEDDLHSGDIDLDLPSSPIEEISSGNLDIEALDDPLTRDEIRSPDMDAPNVPGEVDIEALDEDDLDLTDLPADARLDPLEE